MLYDFLKSAVRQLWGARPVPKRRIVFVCATRLSEKDFWQTSPTGQGLAQLQEKSGRVTSSIAFENGKGLPTVYNQALEETRRGDIVVFLHDDVWLPVETIEASIYRGLANFDVVGVAGNRRRIPLQPSWIFHKIEGGQFLWDYGNLSGNVTHGSPDDATQQDYGPMPASCELLDGVLLAALAGRLKSTRATFDERFDFHFYDVDFCRTARAAGLRLGTWPVAIIHQSAGDFGGPRWVDNYHRYLSKWEQESVQAHSDAQTEYRGE